jgi:hypothetical protein
LDEAVAGRRAKPRVLSQASFPPFCRQDSKGSHLSPSLQNRHAGPHGLDTQVAARGDKSLEWAGLCKTPALCRPPRCGPKNGRIQRTSVLLKVANLKLAPEIADVEVLFASKGTTSRPPAPWSTGKPTSSMAAFSASNRGASGCVQGVLGPEHPLGSMQRSRNSLPAGCIRLKGTIYIEEAVVYH